jgi:hypothetical protein
VDCTGSEVHVALLKNEVLASLARVLVTVEKRFEEVIMFIFKLVLAVVLYAVLLEMAALDRAHPKDYAAQIMHDLRLR